MCLCVSVGHEGEPYKTGRTDRSAIWLVKRPSSVSFQTSVIPTTPLSAARFRRAGSSAMADTCTKTIQHNKQQRRGQLKTTIHCTPFTVGLCTYITRVAR